MDLVAELAKHGRTINDIAQIYSGRENSCRCGCHGKYFTPADKGFSRALARIQKPDFKPLEPMDDMKYGVSQGVVFDDGVFEANLDIPYDAEHDKCYCLYFKPLAV